MQRPPCQAEPKPGQRCRGWALPGRLLCWAHDPSRADDRRAARAKGGRLSAIAGRRRKLSTPAAVVDFLSGLTHDVIEGRKDPDLVKVVAYALSVQLKAIELAEQADARRLLGEVRELASQVRRA